MNQRGWDFRKLPRRSSEATRSGYVDRGLSTLSASYEILGRILLFTAAPAGKAKRESSTWRAAEQHQSKVAAPRGRGVTPAELWAHTDSLSSVCSVTPTNGIPS